MATKANFFAKPKLGCDCKSHAHAPETRLGVETRKAIAVFCGIGLDRFAAFGDLPPGPECGIFLTPRRLH